MLLRLKKHIVYGPVHSRRLGRSLGINLLPAEVKVCTFNCLYCQYGWTDFSSLSSQEFPNPETIYKTVEAALKAIPESPACITFSGHGEPTLHPKFPEIVQGINRLRDRFTPQAQTVLLSNATTTHRPGVQEALKELDLCILKLDAGDPDVLTAYNNPAPGITLKGILNALSKIENLTIQALFAAGPAGNDSPEHLNAWVNQIERITPINVQIYSLDREYPSTSIHKLEPEGLHHIQHMLSKKNIRAEVYE